MAGCVFGEARDGECHWFCDNLEQVRIQQDIWLRTYIPGISGSIQVLCKDQRETEKRERRLMEIVLIT